VKEAKKLWSMTVVGSKVIRIDPEVFRVLQRIAIEERMESSTPAQVLRKVFEENDLMGDSHGKAEIRRDVLDIQGDVESGGQRRAS
jgi:hypothetical protein